MTYPIIADPNRQIIKQLNMVDPDEKDSSGNPLPSRALHMIGPDKTVILFFFWVLFSHEIISLVGYLILIN